MAEVKSCVGCGKNEALFQCPLCQAEEAEGEGYFCSQECFGKNWLKHRNEVHGGGTVRAGAKRKRDEPADDQKASKTKSKKDKAVKETAAAESVEAPVAPISAPVCPPWVGLPPFADCRESGWAVVSPHITGDTPKAIIRVPFTGESDNFVNEIFWTTAIAATEAIRTSLAASTMEFVVVCGSPLTAHAFAWATRCAGLSRLSKIVLSTADEDMRKNPKEYFASETSEATQGQIAVRIVITSTTVLRCVQGEKKSLTNISDWMDGRTLITMPDVEDPENLQSMNSKAWYFVGRPAVTHGTPFKALDQFEEDELEHHIKSLAPIVFQSPLKTTDIGVRFDNDASTCLARGNLKGFLERMVNIFSHSKNRFEEILTNSLFCDWGCIGGDVLVAHHKIAYVMRFLVDHSDKFANSNLSLAQIAVRTVCRVAKTLPKIPVAKKNSDLTNLYLQATVCYCFELLSSASVDSFGASWGFDKVLSGAKELSNANRVRAELVARVRSRYGAQLGAKYGDFLVILMHLLYDAVSVWSLTKEEVDRATQFSAILSHEAGPLDKFLITCDLTGPRSENSQKKSLLSASKTESVASGLIKPSNQKYVCALSFTPLPLSGRRQRAVERLKNAAIDEVLSAMPRLPIPMYIGDVGNLIGIWTKFNNKYDGALGYTLSEFLLANPEHFTVVGNLVTRVKAGLGDQVRVRYDNEIEEGSDDDDDSRKRRDREALTGLGKKGKGQPVHHSAKARKKAEKKQRNFERYNRNHVKFDPEKKVPGYVKHGPRKIKGRGRKANIRTSKRSS